MPKQIEDEFTSESLTASQRHRRRKRKAGICGWSGCHEEAVSDKCEKHREIVNRYNVFYRESLKEKSLKTP